MRIINGSSNADTLIGTNSRDQIYGFEGDDRIEGGNGADQLYGGAGDDHLLGGAGNDALYGGEGVNTLEGGAGSDVYYIEGDRQTTIEMADGGIDTVYWMPTSDGGYYVTQAHVEIIHSVTNDTLTPDSETYFIYDDGFGDAQGGNHTIYGGSQGDFYIWNAGRDIFYGGDGDDYVQASNQFGAELNSEYLKYYGGNGDDYLSIQNRSYGFYIPYDEPQIYDYIYFDGGSEFDTLELFYVSTGLWGLPINVYVTLKDVEYLDLRGNFKSNFSTDSPFDLTFTFKTSVTAVNSVEPFDMSYDVFELTHNMQLGATNDYISIDGLAYDSDWPAGQFLVNTGAGDDWLDFNEKNHRGQIAPDTVTVAFNLGAGNDMIFSEGDNVTANGGAGGDYFEMRGSNLILRGAGGDDQITVLEGIDNWISGGQGDDVIDVEQTYGANTLYGGAGDDVIIGGGENDLIYGGTGADFLRGGYGADRFVFLKVDAGAIDTIGDFSSEQGDIIDLAALTSGPLVWRGSLAFTGSANEVRMFNGQVQVDFTADGIADLRINIGYNLTADDFIL